MELHKHIERSYETLLTHAKDARVLLLHPKSKYRSILIAKLIRDNHVPTFYYALGPDDIDLQTFVESITHDLANQHPTFGRHLNMLPPIVYREFEAHVDLVLEAFVREIGELHDSDFFFIFDEYDRSDDADDIHRFMESVADHLPPHCRLVMNSRTLPRLPWVAMIAKQQAALLLDDHLIEQDFYRTHRDENYDLEVFALGPGYVLMDGEAIESWEGHLPRLLFFFSLDRPIVTRSEICQAFWPDLDPDQAVNVFHVTKRRLHKALDKDVLVHSESHYQVNPSFNVYYDVLEFVETLMRGRNDAFSDEDRFKSWQHIARMYRGPFLQGHNDEWIERRRVAFRAGYLEALTAMAQRWIDRGRKELALKLYQRAIEADFKRQDFHRDIMQLYTELGRRGEAVEHYRHMEDVFLSERHLLEPATQQVYADITV